MNGPTTLGARPFRLPPAPENVASARRFTRHELDALVPDDTVALVELLVGELVTNAVVHARSEFEVRVTARDGRVRVEVCDLRPDRALVSHDHHPYASTGRGLTLIEELTNTHGVQYAPDHKTVWFELGPEEPEPSASAWETTRPPGPTSTVTLIDMPYVLYAAAQQHWEAMLRELTLAEIPPERIGVRVEDLAAAQDASDLICSCVTASVQQKTLDSPTVSLLVEFPADAVEPVARLRGVLDAADAQARQANLLTLPALPQIRGFRQWLLDQIVGQLSGGDPVAWTLSHDGSSTAPAELAPWDSSMVDNATVPTVAADESNRIVAANVAAARMLGWQAAELIGQRLTVLMPEHLRARHEAAFTSLLLTGQAHILGRYVPFPALHRDGRQIPIRLRIETQEAMDGHTVFLAQLQRRTKSRRTRRRRRPPTA